MLKINVKAILPVLFILISCKKRGCQDFAAENYDNTAQKHNCKCTYRFNDSIVFTNIPLKKSNGSSWDSAKYEPPSPPDLYLYLYPNSNFDKRFRPIYTRVNEDFIGSTIVLFKEWKAYYWNNDTWFYELRDDDHEEYPQKDDDIISSGKFNPILEGSNGKINVVFTNGVGMTIYYHN